MKARCSNPNSKNYPIYGGRGITVCDEWNKSFENFLKEMGERPSENVTLDRIDVNGNYEPNNCRWATFKQQACNKQSTIKMEYNGETMTLVDICELENKDYDKVKRRIVENKWSLKDALFTDFSYGNKKLKLYKLN